MGRARQEWKGWTGVGSMDRVGLDRGRQYGQGGLDSGRAGQG